MKKFITFFLFLFPVFSLFSFTKDDIKLFTLENGLKIYYLEDSSSPTVRLELCIAAGFTNQGRENGGFFNLYARLLGGNLSNDSVRFVAKVAPSNAERAVLELSEKLKPLQPSDSQLSSILNAMKSEYKDFESSAAGYINTAIDSKIFPENPWTRESGVSSSFASRKNEVVRSILQKIAAEYYIPANSVLFVNGNISETALLEIAKKYFSVFPSLPKKHPEGGESYNSSHLSKSRKFILFHDDFSDEMTQIALQYKNLGRDEADVLSALWNQNDSSFKKLLLKQRNLKILGGEYIDVSSAQEKSSSRLIIQSLLGASKVSPVIQADLFLSMSRDQDVFSKKELQKTLRSYKTEFTRLSESSDRTMEEFSEYLPLHDSSDGDEISGFFSKGERFSQIEISELQKKIQAEEPYVFVFLNTKVYQKYAAEFKKAGFETINQKDSAWYNQTAYKNPADDSQKKSEGRKSLLEEIAASAGRFVSKNLSEFSSLKLKNGIPITLKRSENSNTAVLSLTIAGGELLFTDKIPGLSSVLTGSIAVNIRRQLDSYSESGLVTGFYEVTSRTLSTHSIITVACLYSEIEYAIQAAYTALVYQDISPALADGVTYDERTHWRLKTGSSEFQLLCEAIRLLYKSTDYPKLYIDTEDKPSEKLEFTKIMASYPILLDSSRFSLILSGKLKDDDFLQQALDSTFGNLSTMTETQSIELALPRPDFKKLTSEEKRISIRHLFLTDISKDKAGPRPAVLIPTTKFFDPILYCLPSPDLASTDCALFDALLIELARRMEAALSQKHPEMKVKAQLPENDIPFARIVVTSVARTAEVDALYAQCVKSIKNDISRQIEIQTEGVIDLEKTDLLARLENNWLMAVISEAGSQEGTARLMQSGEIHKNPKLYLEQYEAIAKAKAEDYFLIAESYFGTKAPLSLYSKDSKK